MLIETLVTIVHVLVCVFMVFVILLQPGKDAMGGALGGGAATTAFGGRGAVTFLTKVTAVCAGLFFLTSLSLSLVGLRGSVAAGIAPRPTSPISISADAGVKGSESEEAPVVPAGSAVGTDAGKP